MSGHRRVRQDTSAEQLEAGAPVHLTLDRLEAVDLALDLSGAPRSVHRGSHRGDIFLQPVGEPDHGTERGALGILDPLA